VETIEKTFVRFNSFNSTINWQPRKIYLKCQINHRKLIILLFSLLSEDYRVTIDTPLTWNVILIDNTCHSPVQANDLPMVCTHGQEGFTCENFCRGNRNCYTNICSASHFLAVIVNACQNVKWHQLFSNQYKTLPEGVRRFFEDYLTSEVDNKYMFKILWPLKRARVKNLWTKRTL